MPESSTVRRDVIIGPMMTLPDKRTRAVGCALLILLAGACSNSEPAPVAQVAAAPLSGLAQLGALAYEERLLSSSGRMSCATCHDPAFFHGPPNARPVQVGGTLQTEFGLRAAPSLRYLERQPAFDVGTLHGGLMADGRAGTLAEQVRLPWFSVLEFGLEDSAELVRRLRLTVWGHEFFAHFGESQDNEVIAGQLAEALAAFMREDPGMHRYDSKFDLVTAGRESFTAAELRGRAVYRDPARGNCAGCHPDTSGDGLPPLFTDFRYAAQGLPRNTEIPANADPAYFDLGLCGPQRADLHHRPELCGMFRTPSLRNAAVRPSLFHNGVFHSLAQAVDFYNTRDTDPARWYPQLDGSVQRFNDLPPALRANVTHEPPFGTRTANEPPMNPREVSDLVCFLETLTDAHVAGSPPRRACRN
jgi:cytochrome c peroxidase